MDMPGPISSEMEMLLCGASPEPTRSMKERVRMLAQEDMDWDGVYDLSIRHGVFPLMHQTFSLVNSAHVPQETVDRIGQLTLINAGRNVRMTRQLISLVDALADAGVFAVPIKGPVLSQMLYGDLTLRRHDDLDLFITREDAPAAARCLKDMGLSPEIDLKAEDLEQYTANEDNLAFEGPGANVPVEVHWDLAGGYGRRALPLTAFKDRLWPVSLMGAELHTLDPASYLLYLCIHGAKHGWLKLDMLCCVATLLETYPDMDWKWVEGMARTWGAERTLNLGLFMVHQTLGTEIPGSFLNRARQDNTIQSLGKQMKMRIMGNGKGVSPVRLQFTIRDTIQDRLTYLLRFFTLPTKADWKAFRVPAAVGFVRYGLRPLRLMRGWGRAWR